jgi:negative regulator of sigma E activity
MSGPNEKAEELIGAYLDGELRPAERLEVERYLQSDPQAAELLSQMRSIRSALQSAPIRKLPSNFSERVIAAARQDAAQRGPAAPHWLISPSLANGGKSPNATSSTPLALGVETPSNTNAAVVLPQPVEKSRTTQRWLTVLAIAASTIVIAFIGYKQFNPARDKVTDQEVVSTAPANSSPVVAPANDVNNSNQLAANGNAPAQRDNPEANTNVQPDAANRPVDSLANVSPDNSVPKDSAVIPPQMPLDSPLNASPIVAQSDVDIQKQLESALAISTENLMFVVDISESESASKAEALRQTFERYNIAYELPIEISAELHSLLVKNRMVGPIKPIGGELGNEVSLVFVKAAATRLDAAITDLFSRYDEFPEMSYDMVLNPPAPEALDMLRSIRVFKEFDAKGKSGDANGLARGLRITDRSFVGPERRVPASIDVRKQTPKPVVTDIDMDPAAYCLFIIRQPAAKN